jgi:outer membrane receptor protein involved in Fe transport
MKQTRAFLPVIILLMLAVTGSLLAQNTGKIAGIVVDSQTDEPLIGANVIIEGTMLGASTDLEGNYVILQVPPGKYDVSVAYIGYQKFVYRDVEILTDLTTELNFEIKPEVFEGEEIVVVAEAPLIRKDLTSVEARIQSEEIDRMAVQDLGDLINLQAGVVRDAGGGIHIRGGRSTEVSYMVNGISITDDFSRTQALQIENESIQELQVISGTFNAEYGNAMSGVINVVTKTGGEKITGNIEAWSGDYLSDRTDIFWNIDNINPTANYNLQGTISGPIIRNKLSFFATGRRWYNDGWLYGPNRYSPQGPIQVINGDSVLVQGDSGAVSMNFKDRYSGQASLEWRIATPIKFKVDVLGSHESRRNYNHFYRWNPHGDKGDVERGISVISNLTHQLGKLTFHQLTYAFKYNDLVSKLYDDYNDPRYVSQDLLDVGSQQFAKAGTNLSRFERESQSNIFKWELTSQFTKRHQVKAGLEFQYDRVYYSNIYLIPKLDSLGIQIEPFEPMIASRSSLTTDIYTRQPYKFAAFIQDKIEYESLIINVGLRYDYFDANGKVPSDPSDPNIYNPFILNNIYHDTNGNGIIDLGERTDDNEKTVAEREEYWYKDTSVKTQLSPRLGVAYPITAEGVIHFSYGIFQQLPEYNRLYTGDQLKMSQSSGTYGPYGNPDLKPERTTMYELGLKQQLTQDFAIDVTGFYRDIRNWISTSAVIPTALSGVSYVVFNNRDFANVRGITLAVDRKFADHWGLGFDYTYQISEGTNSNPEQEFYSQQGGSEPTRILTPLDWDQRHSVNGNLFVGGSSWGSNLIGRFYTGQPYTPVAVTATRTGQSILAGLPDNSRNKPNLFTVDLHAYKNFSYGNFDIQFFLKIFNLFDAANPTTVYGDTGQPDYTLLLIAQAAQADPTWFDNPGYYSEPRKIQIGTRISLK